MPGKRTKRTPAPAALHWEIGVDGFPVDPEHPANTTTIEKAFAQRAARRHQANLKRIKAAAEGNRWDAVAVGVRYCRESHEVPPQWLVSAVERLAQHATNPPPKRGRGRPRKPANAAIHLKRWELVDHLIHQHGRTELAAFSEASELSEGEPEAGAPDTFKDSYNIVRTWIRDGLYGRYAPFRLPD